MKKILIFLSFLLMSIGAFGETINITYSDITRTSYNASETTFTNVVSFGYIQTIRNQNGTPAGWATSQVIQMKGGSGILYNKAAISTISNIRVYVVANTNAFTVHYGATSDCTDGEISRPTTATGTEDITYTAYATGGKTTPGTSGTATYYDFDVSAHNPSYFKIVDGSGALYVWKIVITYSSTPVQTTYTVTYNKNANDATGSMTDDNSPYDSGAIVTVLDNEFVRDGYNFVVWNTLANGNGTDYEEGETFTISTNTTLYAQWVIKPTPVTGGKVYELVTDVSDLHVGDKIIILDISKEFAMSTVQKDNNRENTRDFRIIMNGTVVVLNDQSNVQIIQLGQTNSHWTLYTGTDGYLYAASSSANYLRTQTTNNTNGEWVISIDASTYEASIVAQGSFTRNVMQYNSGSDIFACYASASQNGLYIFKESTFSDEYTVTFVNQLGADSLKTQTSLGSIIALPSSMKICQKCYTDNWELEGWVTSLSSTSPIYTNDYIPTSDVSLYAYYKRGSSQTVEVTEYRKVKSNLTDWSGDYLIAYEPSKFADGRIGGTGTGAIGAQNHVIAPETHMLGDTVIDVTWGDTYNVTLEEISEGSGTYVLKTKDNKYNYFTNNSDNGITVNANKATADDYPITVNFVSENDVRISLGGAATGSVFRYNKGGYFRFYHACGQQPVYLYKKVTVQKPLATEYSTAPECDSSFITTWNKDKIFIDKGLSYNLDGKTVTIKDIDTDETLSNSITYDSSTDLYQVNTNLTGKECDKINIFITDNNTDSIYLIYKVPFIVDADAYTTSMDDENCDVVVLPGKKLTVSGTESEHRDVKLYAGAHLSVPSGTEYTVNSLSLRRDNLTTSTLGLTGTISANKLYFDLYVDASDWYFVCLPNTFNLSTLKYINGRIPQYKKNFWVRWYDGEGRAYTQSASWRNVDHDKTFTKGEGFIFALNDVLKKKEFRFELPTSTFTVDGRVDNLHAWGGDATELRPNHKGWNLIGHPFMNSIKTDLAEPITAGQLVPTDTDPWDGKWQVDSTETRGMKRLRYAVIPSKDEEDAPAGYYKSVVLDDYILLPFTSFFIQIGGTDPSTNQCLTFNTTSSGPFSAPRRSLKYDENEELFLRVKVGDRKTGCFISNKFTDEYEPGEDLESRYPIYQSIGGYKLLYSAINDSIIEHGVQVISPQGTLCLDPKVDVSKFEYIYVNHNDNWYNLKNGETVEIESGSFIIQAKRKSNDIPTGFDAIPTNGIYKFSDGKNIYINKNNTIFNVLGKKIK